MNQTPPHDQSDNDTGCCPRFHPEPWDEQTLHFEDKPFVRASTVSVLHVPLNMGRVFARTYAGINAARADTVDGLVLSHDDSPWRAEHLFAVDRAVPGAEMVYLSGTFLTKVFEGPFSQAGAWSDEMAQWVKGKGETLEKLYFFYTTCPNCAKHYGKNYVVALAQVGTSGV